MAKKQADPLRSRGIFWPTLGLIIFLLIWLAACGASFWYLYQGIVGRSSEPDVALRALQWMTWPFTVLAVAGPLLLLLSVGGLRVVRDLLDMQKLIVGLPSQVEMMQDTVVEFRALRTQLITDVSRVNDATAEGDDAPPEGSAESPQQRPEVEEFIQLYEKAKERFYKALEDYNTSAAEPLIVQRGGANFSEIAAVLRDKRAFDRSDDRNRRVAKFVTRAFELERSTRRNSRAGLGSAQVQELRSLTVSL
jgi:hypothetical protein